ncbi:unnamed protein product [Gongylonema pulchrum]|uniref:NOPS domain-containing protein n=1 Tax=Gongylonema pulchrum TaxID=637853 RepID=A0A183E8E7_9BILA|nr:unnamed protein product [Gongylonema pulchrum]
MQAAHVLLSLCREREVGPRFPPANSFEYVFGLKWKELYELERQRRAQLEEELKEARRRLEADMDLAYQDYQTQILREGKPGFLALQFLPGLKPMYKMVSA